MEKKEKREGPLEWEMGDLIRSNITGKLYIPYQLSTLTYTPLDGPIGTKREVPSVLMHEAATNRIYNVSLKAIVKESYSNLSRGDPIEPAVVERMFATTNEIRVTFEVQKSAVTTNI